ncbi:hypothetical protein [Streptomyces aureus]
MVVRPRRLTRPGRRVGFQPSRRATFETDLGSLGEPSDDQVSDTIKHVVLRLNAIDDGSHPGGAGYDTGEREQLCEYIDETLTEHGFDLAAMAARRGIGRAEIADEWREW